MQGFVTLRRRRLTLKIRISYIVIRIYKLPFAEFFEMDISQNKGLKAHDPIQTALLLKQGGLQIKIA